MYRWRGVNQGVSLRLEGMPQSILLVENIRGVSPSTKSIIMVIPVVGEANYNRNSTTFTQNINFKRGIEETTTEITAEKQ